MKLSLLVFDLDGTAIPNDPLGKPSPRVIAAVKAAQAKVITSIATGRVFGNSEYIFQTLNITSPSILSGGTQVFDPSLKKVLWEKAIPQAIAQQIIEISKPYPYSMYVSDSLETQLPSQIKIDHDERVLYLMTVAPADAEKIVSQLNNLTNIAAHAVKSWTPGHFDLHITHSQATKRNAMHELMKILQVNGGEVMVVGDSNNDLPLFESAGLKIAMGNGSEALKKQADWVAPSVDEDGLAVAIEKYLLKD